jgi:hypothetical protein
MELTEDSETSANHNMTPGKYPKEYIQSQYIPTHQIKADGNLLLGMCAFGAMAIKHDNFYEQNAMSHATSAIKWYKYYQ